MPHIVLVKAQRSLLRHQATFCDKYTYASWIGARYIPWYSYACWSLKKYNWTCLFQAGNTHQQSGSREVLIRCCQEEEKIEEELRYVTSTPKHESIKVSRSPSRISRYWLEQGIHLNRFTKGKDNAKCSWQRCSWEHWVLSYKLNRNAKCSPPKCFLRHLLVTDSISSVTHSYFNCLWRAVRQMSSTGTGLELLGQSGLEPSLTASPSSSQQDK